MRSENLFNVYCHTYKKRQAQWCFAIFTLYFLEFDKYQRKRIKSNSLCPTPPHAEVQELQPEDLFRQPDSVEIHKQSWRNSLRITPEFGNRNSEIIQPVPGTTDMSPYPGDQEQRCRQTQSEEDTIVRMDVAKDIVPAPSTPMGSSNIQDRRLCSETQQETTDILEPATTSSEPEVEATMIGTSMPSNQPVAKVEREDEVDTHPATLSCLKDWFFPPSMQAQKMGMGREKI
jgi:hypothetical protein